MSGYFVFGTRIAKKLLKNKKLKNKKDGKTFPSPGVFSHYF